MHFTAECLLHVCVLKFFPKTYEIGAQLSANVYGAHYQNSSPVILFSFSYLLLGEWRVGGNPFLQLGLHFSS